MVNQLTILIPRVYMSQVFKVLLIILPKHSLIEFQQGDGKRKKKKQHKVIAQKGYK